MYNNSLREPTFVSKTFISPSETLKNMKIGETVIIPSKKIKPGIVRSTAQQLKRRSGLEFEVTEAGLVNEVKVTRLK